MKGFIKLTAIEQGDVEAVRASLLDDEWKTCHAAGVKIAAELEDVSLTDRLTLMSALGTALKFDKDDWTVLFMMKSGIGPIRENFTQVAIDKNTAKGGI